MRVDAHQHFWDLRKVEYPWLGPHLGPLYANFQPPDLVPHLMAAGVERTVLVQAADSFEDTVAMLTQADAYDWIGGVVGWVPLLDPVAARRALDRYTRHPKFKGVRHLIHDEHDPDWILQPAAIDGLKLLADYGLSFDVVAVYPNHLRHVPTLAERVPELTLIIDHLAKPPIRAGTTAGWVDELAAAARCPNVFAKLSGLNTAADPVTWCAADLQPYVDIALEQFGPERLMFGSDWPVALLAGDYARVWAETQKTLAACSPAAVAAILGGTAMRVYRLT